ncbi:MAG TPA: hypothetical protein PLY87_10865, partial [Planctomycetaceae bacterium]|nr:hypothetical protein [Planctomycetaceae bacterium]
KCNVALNGSFGVSSGENSLFGQMALGAERRLSNGIVTDYSPEGVHQFVPAFIRQRAFEDRVLDFRFCI